MGQYYYPCLLDEKTDRPTEYAYPHDFGDGVKLMEHSWLENGFVRFIEQLLIEKPRRLVWAGDYADSETLSEDEIEIIFNKYKDCEDSKYFTREKLRDEGMNFHDLCGEIGTKLLPSKKIAPMSAKYLLNYDKKQFVNKSKIPKQNDGYRVHPLPLLTCEGNGQGCGDYFSDAGVQYIGNWSRDLIGVVSKKSDIPKDFIELEPKFSY